MSPTAQLALEQAVQGKRKRLCCFIGRVVINLSAALGRIRPCCSLAPPQARPGLEADPASRRSPGDKGGRHWLGICGATDRQSSCHEHSACSVADQCHQLFAVALLGTKCSLRCDDGALMTLGRS
ncbi:hypothetical protein ACFFX0_33400 [Citricoccus parietis]|uniref:Uncharacterized protein n=1 Tax=Citricoccus parietis TaxID=592307 RepID=A0ABV5GA16_9MICC